LVEVAINDPVTGEERDEEKLKKLANDFLAMALGLDVQEITELVLNYGPRVSSHRRLRHSFHLQAPITNAKGGCLLHDDSFIPRALYASGTSSQ
jgi:hypothetical protein